MGTILLYLTAILGIAAIASTILRLYTKGRIYEDIARLMVFSTFFVTTVTFFLMVYYFMVSDLHIEYVHHYTHVNHEWQYKLAGVWGGEKGTILLWIWLISLSLAFEDLFQHIKSRKLGDDLERNRFYDWVRLVAMIILVAFIMYAILTATFKTTSSADLIQAPDGWGLNPLLLTPLMTVHPPVEFAAYAFMTLPLAAALANLATGSRNWTEVSLQWSRLSWFFLTLGIGVGALWAYTVLGWGGYWGWDPVEVANLIPWIALTGFVHAQQYSRKRRQFAFLAPLLAIVTFVLILFATFETRSGLVESPLHAFTGPGAGLADPGDRLVAILEGNTAAAFFMMLMLATLIVGGILFMWRFAQIRKKEGSLDNLAFASSVAFIIFLSTLLGFVVANVASFVSLGLDLASFAGHTGIGVAILTVVLISYPLIWILFTSQEPEEESKPITLNRVITDKNVMIVSVAIFIIWFVVTFLLMLLGSEGLQPEVFTSRLPFIIAALAIAMTVCLAWAYLGKTATAYLIVILVIAVLVTTFAFSDVPLAIYVSVLVFALIASILRIFKIAVGGKGKDRNVKLQAGGLFLLISGTLGILYWSNLTRIYYLLPAVKPDLVIGTLGFIASFAALIGGLHCLRGRSPTISIIGSIGAILSLGFFFIGTILGVVSLILILMSLSSFSRESTDVKSTRALLGGTAPHVIHLGIVLLLVGYAASSSSYLVNEKDFQPLSEPLMLDSPVDFGQYDFTLVRSEGYDLDGDGNFTEINAYVEISQEGFHVGEATLHLWWMIPANPNDPPHYMLDVYVENTYAEDIYFIPYAFHTDDDGWIQAMGDTGNMFTSDQVDGVGVQVKNLPLMSALWGGMWMMTFGIFLLIFVDYLPVPVRQKRAPGARPEAPVEKETPVKEVKGEVILFEDTEIDYEKKLEEELAKLEE
jgi:cytochrome c-type biogenesis protein CcmF